MSETTAEVIQSALDGAAAAPAVEPSASLRDAIRARIKGAPAYSSEKVVVAEWGVEIDVRSMTLGERNKVLRLSQGDDGKVDVSKLSVLAVIDSAFDADGVKVFGPADTDWLASLDAKAIDKLVLTALDINGFSGKKIEDAAKKSDSTETSA